MTEEKPNMKKGDDDILEKQIKISFSLRGVLLFLVWVVLILSAFALGRYALPSCGGEMAAVDVSEEATTATGASSTNLIQVGDYICPDGTKVSSSSDCPEEEPEVEEEEEAPVVVEESTEEEEEEEEAPVVEEKEEIIEAPYKNVKIEFDGEGIAYEDKDTYYRVTKIYYKITNTEDGTIKPKYIKYILMDGYSKEKTYTLPVTYQTIKKNKVAKTFLPGSPSLGSTTQDTAEYKIILYDADNEKMAEAKKKFTLS